MKFSAKRFVRPAIMLVCALIPPMVTNRGWWMVGRTEDGYGEPLEVLGAMVSVALLVYAYRAYRSHAADRTEKIVARAVTGAVVIQFLLVMVSFWGTSWDYRCYDAAARNLARGLNPYQDTAYLYPPLLAQAMVMVNNVVTSTRLFVYDKVTSWWIVFYFYQTVQLLLVFLIAEELFGYARRLRVPLTWAAVTVAATVLLDTPFFNTIRFQQVNLWVLFAVLYSMGRLRERPIRCGALMALAVMVKPLGLIFPILWFLIGARKAALAFVAAAAVLVVAQAGFGTDWTAWHQFFGSSVHIPQYNDYFRNQSLFSLFSTLLHTIHVDADKQYLLYFVRVCQLAIAGWFVARFLDREKRFRSWVGKFDAARRLDSDLLMRVGGHTVDVALLALLCDPVAWDHHYVILAPVVAWVLAVSSGRVPRRVVIALVLIFVPTTFDLWLFSYYRLAGAVLLAIALAPSRVFDVRRATENDPAPGWAPAVSSSQ